MAVMNMPHTTIISIPNVHYTSSTRHTNVHMSLFTSGLDNTTTSHLVLNQTVLETGEIAKLEILFSPLIVE